MQSTFSMAGARSSPTPAPACSVRFRALIAAEWYHDVRIRRCDRLVAVTCLPIVGPIDSREDGPCGALGFPGPFRELVSGGYLNF
jgi:hypothetical protein